MAAPSKRGMIARLRSIGEMEATASRLLEPMVGLWLWCSRRQIWAVSSRRVSKQTTGCGSGELAEWALGRPKHSLVAEFLVKRLIHEEAAGGIKQGKDSGRALERPLLASRAMAGLPRTSRLRDECRRLQPMQGHEPDPGGHGASLGGGC